MSYSSNISQINMITIQAFYKYRKFQELEDYCDALLIRHPEDLDILSIKTDAQNELGKYGKALAGCEKMLSISPKNDYAKNRKATLLTKTDNCCWCGDQKTLKELKGDVRHEVFGNYLICDYCMEGIEDLQYTRPENITNEILIAAVREMLFETTKTPSLKRGNGYNNFIYAINEILERSLKDMSSLK